MQFVCSGADKVFDEGQRGVGRFFVTSVSPINVGIAVSVAAALLREIICHQLVKE